MSGLDLDALSKLLSVPTRYPSSDNFQMMETLLGASPQLIAAARELERLTSAGEYLARSERRVTLVVDYRAPGESTYDCRARCLPQVAELLGWQPGKDALAAAEHRGASARARELSHPVCRGCGVELAPECAWVADGCPCNAPRGVNHGLVPRRTCTCVACDPEQTGGTRLGSDASAQAQSFLDRSEARHRAFVDVARPELPDEPKETT